MDTDAGGGFPTGQGLRIITTPSPGTQGVPPCCQEPMGPCLLPGHSHGGGSCWCGPDGAGSNAPPGRTATPCGSDVVGSGVGFADFPRGRRPDRNVALAEEPHGSLAGTRNPWVPLLAPEEGVPLCGPDRAGHDISSVRTATPCGSRPDAFQSENAAVGG